MDRSHTPCPYGDSFPYDYYGQSLCIFWKVYSECLVALLGSVGVDQCVFSFKKAERQVAPNQIFSFEKCLVADSGFRLLAESTGTNNTSPLRAPEHHLGRCPNLSGQAELPLVARVPEASRQASGLYPISGGTVEPFPWSGHGQAVLRDPYSQRLDPLHSAALLVPPAPCSLVSPPNTAQGRVLQEGKRDTLRIWRRSCTQRRACGPAVSDLPGTSTPGSKPYPHLRGLLSSLENSAMPVQSWEAAQRRESGQTRHTSMLLLAAHRSLDMSVPAWPKVMKGGTHRPRQRRHRRLWTEASVLQC